MGKKFDSSNDKVVVALSGGPASAVAAALLKSQGFDVYAVHFVFQNKSVRHYEPPSETTEFDPITKQMVPRAKQAGLGPVKNYLQSFHCFANSGSEEREKNAKRIADKLKIPLKVIDVMDAFEAFVIDETVHSYLSQKIPNPCIACNRYIKFRFLTKHAESLNISQLATGHYAQLSLDVRTGLVHLKPAIDVARDQSFLLYSLGQKILKNSIFPIGALSAKMIYRLSGELGFSDDTKNDPREVCFTGGKDFKPLVEARSAYSLRFRGIVKTHDNHVVGDHEGLYQFVIGQKGGYKISVKEPEKFKVVGFDSIGKVLYIGSDAQLYHSQASAVGARWVQPVSGLKMIECEVKLSANDEARAAKLTLFENQAVYIEFLEPQFMLRPGEHVVFYREGEILGGAILDRLGPLEIPKKA